MLLHNQVKKVQLADVLLPERLDSGIEKLKAGFQVRLEAFHLACSLLLRDQWPMPFPSSSLLFRSHIFSACVDGVSVQHSEGKPSVAYSLSL